MNGRNSRRGWFVKSMATVLLGLTLIALATSPAEAARYGRRGWGRGWGGYRAYRMPNRGFYGGYRGYGYRGFAPRYYGSSYNFYRGGVPYGYGPALGYGYGGFAAPVVPGLGYYSYGAPVY
jgi:hypothetical protein